MELVWQAILPAGGLSSPPSRYGDEFLGLRCGMPARHDAGEIPADGVVVCSTAA